MGVEVHVTHEDRRKFLQTGITLAAGLVLNEVVDEIELTKDPLGSPKEISNPQGDTVLLFADIHVGEKNSPKQANKDAIATLRKTVDSLLPYHFDLVAQLGDMIKETNDRGTNFQNALSTLRLINKLNADKYLHLIGNHDLLGLSNRDLLDLFRQANQTPEFYGLHDLTYHQVVWLDLVMDQNKTASLDPRRLEWFKDTVDHKKPIIVLSHYSLVELVSTNSYYFHNTPKKTAFSNSEEIWPKINDLPIRAIISGHVHWGGYQKLDHTHLITIPSFSENIYDKQNPGVYTILQLSENGIHLQNFSRGSPYLNLNLV